MEDDIDIEEHDVLDNPRIRTIFPDLARIKEEIPDQDYHGSDQEMEYQPYSEGHQHQEEEDDSEYARYGNKIILGSKPARTLQVSEDIQDGESVLVFGRKPVEIKQEVEEYEETREEDRHEEDLPEEPYTPASTVLILGSKPSSSGLITPMTSNDVSNNTERVKSKTKFFDVEIDLNCETDDQETNDSDNDHVGDDDHDVDDDKDPTTAFVLLENWGPHLESSCCYCKECLILFPTSNTLLAHNMTAHSFLVAVDKNKAVKSTAKPNKPVADSGKFCNHCNKMFPDSDSLISHLYQILTFDKSNATFKPQPKKVVANTFIKMPQAMASDDEFETEMPVHAQGAFDLFQCEVCSYYCEVYGVLARHMNNNHAKKKFNQRKVLYNGTCKHCNTKIKSKLNYNRHIKMCHSNLYNYKGPMTPKKPVPRKLPVPTHPTLTDQKMLGYQNQKYQCQICSEIFMNYFQARQHRQSKHPESHTQNIFKRITNLGNKTVCVQKARIPPKNVANYPKIAQKLKEDQTQPDISASTSKSPQNDSPDLLYKLKNQIVIPKSVIFKCNKCPIHFTSCTVSVLHAKSCTKQKGDWKCNICEREFQSFDQNVHRRQHQISKTLNVIVNSENLYGKVLSQCPNCKLYFHEKDFYLHEQKAFCKGAGAICKQCTLPIHASAVSDHNKWHKRLEFNKKNVIVVEYCSVPIEHKTILPVKRELDFESSIPVKKAKMESFKPTIEVRYCLTCGLYMFRCKHIAKHLNGKCIIDPILKRKRLCKICGLTYTSKSHYMYHSMHPNVTVMDMKFVTVKERKTIAPPMPIFPKCKKCEVHFFKKDTVMTHSCKDSYKTCSYCQERFSDLAFKLHMKFHEYHTQFKGGKSVVNGSSYSGSTPKSEMMDPLPELLKKYEQLTNTWQILFLCQTCDIICDSYDRAVEHCQKHYNNMESYGMVIQHCQQCDLKFDSSSFEKHKGLHAQNARITKDSFTILPYKYTNLLNFKWLGTFKSLPETQLQQILSQSIYRHGRSVKLRVVEEGAPETVVYRCGKCNTYIHPLTLTNHYKNVSCNENATKFYCRHCKIPFNTCPAKDYHQRMHSLAKAFTVVYFNENGDEEFNQKLQENDAFRRTYAMGPVRGKGKAKFYHYYMCVKCNCCSTSKIRVDKHRCSDAKLIARCHLCNLHFNKAIITKHYKLHEINSRFTKKNIKVTQFKPRSSKGGSKILKEKESVAVKLYKCQCGLHFTSIKATEKHFEVCGTDNDVAKEKCSKCDRLFDTTQLVTHLCKHHSKDDKDTEFEVIDVTPGVKIKTQDDLTPQAGTSINTDIAVNDQNERINLYKCKKCDVYYLSPGGLWYHFEANHMTVKIRPCPYCKLKFMPKTLQKHIQQHHCNLQCRVKDFKIHVGVTDKQGVLRLLECGAKAERLKFAPKPASISAPKPASKTAPKSHLKKAVDLKAYSNTLYKCTTCRAHFLTVQALHTHKFKNKNFPTSHTTELETCPDCNYSFASVFSLLRHQNVHHKQMKLERKDIVIKDKFERYDYDSDEESDKSQNSTDNEDKNDCPAADALSLTKTDDTDDDMESISNVKARRTLVCPDDEQENVQKVKTYKYTSILFKCALCNITYFNSSSIESHIKNHEAETQVVLVPCYCGLSLGRTTLAKHEIIHHSEDELTIDDLYIITMDRHGDGNMVGSKHIFRCETCQVHFTKLPVLETHLSYVEHAAKKADCSICGLTFLKQSLKIHVKLHHDIMNLNREDLVIFESVGKNKLKLVSDSENIETKTEETSSSVQDLDSEKFDTKTEESCSSIQELDSENLETEAEETCSSLLELESDNLETKRKSTRTSGQGQNSKKSKSETEKNKSVQALARFNKKYEVTLHKCVTCGTHFLNPGNLALHQKHCPSLKYKTAICEECQLKFSAHGLGTHVLRHHMNKHLKAEEFEIIHYGCDEQNKYTDTNKSVSVYFAKESNTPVESSKHITIPKTLYKCNVCSIHFLKKTVLLEHLRLKTSTDECAVSCPKCGLLFTTQGRKVHQLIQHNIHKLKIKDFEIIDHIEAGLGKYSCKKIETGNGEAAVEGNNEENTSNINQDCDNDAVIDLSEPETSIDVKKDALYRCDKCKCCMFSYDSIRTHYDGCQDTEITLLIKCIWCQLMFQTAKDVQYHKKQHHDRDNFKLKDIVVMNYTEASLEEIKPIERQSPKKVNISEEISTLDKDLYTKQLFKCSTCSIHFLVEKSLEHHIKTPDVNIIKSTCTFCGLMFNVNTLPTHVYIHHDKMKLTAKDFIITSKEENMEQEDSDDVVDINVKKEEIDITSKNKRPSIKDEENDKTIVLNSISSKCIEIKTNETGFDDKNAINIDKDPIVLKTVTPADSFDKDVECESKDGPSSSKSNTDKANTIKLYKCAVCNVCFLSQTSCYKHATKHITLDPKDYIECKLCGYQFLILNNSLHKHITKHHNINFNPEDVLIEEYNPDILCHGSPKIDIYFGTDKVQSKLISTTSDTNVSSELSEDSERDINTPDNSIDLDKVSDMGTTDSLM